MSVVTPFHNTASYLPECIESVLAQTHGDFEYLLVENHSTDGSGEIAESYARLDSRVRVLRPERLLSQVQNYNFGLAQAAADSRYVKLVQADDWLFPRCLEDLGAAADAYPSAAVVSSYRMVEQAVDGEGLHPKDGLISGREACRMHLLGRGYLFGSATTLLLRADTVRARVPSHAEPRPHEDTEVLFEILEDDDFCFVHQVLSFTRRQEGSLMASAGDFKPHALDRYIITKRYGRRFLSEAEFLNAQRSATRHLYAGLADQWLAERFAGTNAAFWAYQERGLSSVGETLDRALLARFVAERSARKLLSPVEMARGVLGRRRAR